MTIEEIIQKINSENDFAKQYLAIYRYYNGYYLNDRGTMSNYTISYIDDNIRRFSPNRILCYNYMSLSIIIKEKNSDKIRVLIDISPTGLRHSLYGSDYKKVKKKMLYALYYALKNNEEVNYTYFPFNLMGMEFIKKYEIDGKYNVTSERLVNINPPFSVTRVMNDVIFDKMIINDIFPKHQIMGEIKNRYKYLDEKEYS